MHLVKRLSIFLCFIAAFGRECCCRGDVDTDYRSGLRCGPNSLFLFLLLSGRNIDFKELDGIPLSPKGTSLLALRDAARKVGVKAEIRHFHLSEIKDLPLPAVVQLRYSYTTITPDHFDVIYRLQGNNIYLLDGTSGDKRVMVREKLSYWTGYALVRAESKAWRFTVGATVLLLTAANCFVIKSVLGGKASEAK